MLEDGEVIIDQVELPANEQDEGMKDAEIEDNGNNSEEEDKVEKEAVG